MKLHDYVGYNHLFTNETCQESSSSYRAKFLFLLLAFWKHDACGARLYH